MFSCVDQQNREFEAFLHVKIPKIIQNNLFFSHDGEIFFTLPSKKGLDNLTSYYTEKYKD